MPASDGIQHETVALPLPISNDSPYSESRIPSEETQTEKLLNSGMLELDWEMVEWEELNMRHLLFNESRNASWLEYDVGIFLVQNGD